MAGQSWKALTAVACLRIISRLDIKGANLIKGVNMEGLRVIGDPAEFARRYYEQRIDELLYIDTVASLYGRNSLHDLVDRTVRTSFIPLTVGGGIRSVEDVDALLRAGADKVAINTAAVRRPELLREISQRFGSQCLVASIQAKQVASGKWEAYIEGGREHSGLDAVQWALRTVEFGAGEILLTSVDRDGTMKGFDVPLVREIAAMVPIPVIACGGMGKPQDAVEVVKEGLADAVASASALHYDVLTVTAIRDFLRQSGIPVRQSSLK